jgi:erythrin-vacuolar iron transport family protein
MTGPGKKQARGLTGLEVLGVAIRSEVEACRFYIQALKGVRNPILRDKLSRLAAEEKRHRQILEERYRRSSGEKVPPVPRKGGLEGKGKMPKELSPEEMLTLAIRMEQQAAQFYQREALKTADMSGRFMLEYLADFERTHERSLQAELKALNRFPDWFSFKDPIVLLVGP